MKTVSLGKTGLVVTELGFGGIPIIPLGFEDGVKVVKHCFDRGITFFDTANVYGDSEKKIGQALESVRDRVVLATKTQKRDAESAAKHIKYSLENLRTDYIDIYQFHNIPNEDTLEQVLAPGGAYEAVRQSRDRGEVKFIGFSSHDIATAIKACLTNLFATIQFPFNFIEKEPADELFKAAQEHDMGIIGMKPLGGGLLERADLCFKFLQQHPYVVPIPGFSTTGEVDEVVGLYRSREPLTDADLRDIEKIRSELGTRFCHRCGYCIPCEQGVMIPNVMSFRSSARRLAPVVAVQMVKAAMESVENCTECEECLEKCPYNLQIPGLLKENLAFYKEVTNQSG
ncbi:MAG: aldo/keto reductase [Deltaproteobacteria bacterium]|nr:aldo/keto reductase [Deltaproteobacteria bacterium]MBW2051171.1 aldo/keto reductase [Deltaproteobacteria bacterium]MBW2140003.1 aldo/keto reductase [Deltaproteobacteria bacterium]